MIARLAAVLSVIGVLSVGRSVGQEIVERPEELRFEPLTIELPTGESLRHELSNGIPVYIAEDDAVPLVDIAVALPVGGFLDPADKVGLASLTAAMLRRGGTEGLTPAAFDAAVDDLGAELDSSGGTTRSGLSLNCTTDVLDVALDLLVEALRRPRFDADRLEQARTNLLQSLLGRNDDPLAVLDREWRWLLWGRQHYAARALTSTTLERIRRSDLVTFHRRHWRPERLVLAVSGDVSAEDVLARLEKRLGDWPADASGGGPIPQAGSDPSPPGVYHVEMPTPQVKVALGHEGLRRRSWDDPDAWAVMVLREVLAGDGPVSRLRRRLRAEEGLVYRVRSHLGIGVYGAGEFQVFLEAEPQSVARAVEIVVEEIEALRQREVPEVELGLAKRVLLDGFPLLFDGAERIAGRFAEDALIGRPHGYWVEYRRRIGAVSAREVRRAARRHLRPEALLYLLVGPWDAIDGAAVAALAEGEVRHLPARDPLTLKDLSR